MCSIRKEPICESILKHILEVAQWLGLTGLGWLRYGCFQKDEYRTKVYLRSKALVFGPIRGVHRAPHAGCFPGNALLRKEGGRANEQHLGKGLKEHQLVLPSRPLNKIDPSGDRSYQRVMEFMSSRRW